MLSTAVVLLNSLLAVAVIGFAGPQLLAGTVSVSVLTALILGFTCYLALKVRTGLSDDRYR